MSRRIEMIGRKFGRWTVVSESENRGGRGQLKFICVCDCGQVGEVLGESLRQHKSLSCGCYNKERAREVKTTHGGSKERLYHVWQGMKDRCFNSNSSEYKNYGGRGITVCDAWLDYSNFKEFMLKEGYNPNAPHGECTIERIDVNGNYCPENCTIIPMSEQVYNRTCNRYITVDGETKLMSEWAREMDINVVTIIHRIKKGMTPEEAIIAEKAKFIKFTVDNETHTTMEWAEILGIPWSTLRCRMYKNGKQEELERIVRSFRKGESIINSFENHYLTYKGEIKTVSEWAKQYGLKEGTVFGRLDRGWNVEDAITKPVQSAKRYEMNGESHTRKEWSDITGISLDVIKKRTREGWTMAQIVDKYGRRS